MYLVLVDESVIYDCFFDIQVMGFFFGGMSVVYIFCLIVIYQFENLDEWFVQNVVVLSFFDVVQNVLGCFEVWYLRLCYKLINFVSVVLIVEFGVVQLYEFVYQRFVMCGVYCRGMYVDGEFLFYFYWGCCWSVILEIK